MTIYLLKILLKSRHHI